MENIIRQGQRTHCQNFGTFKSLRCYIFRPPKTKASSDNGYELWCTIPVFDCSGSVSNNLILTPFVRNYKDNDVIESVQAANCTAWAIPGSVLWWPDPATATTHPLLWSAAANSTTAPGLGNEYWAPLTTESSLVPAHSPAPEHLTTMKILCLAVIIFISLSKGKICSSVH